MKEPKILIIKTGSTYRQLRAQQGDFGHWIRQSANAPQVLWKTKRLAAIEPPEIGHYDALILTGSHTSLSKPYDLLEGSRRLLETILEQGIPTLGICFGHQLINKLLGGVVVRNPLGLEMGISKIHLTIEGLGHPLFKGINPANFEVYSSHSDAVTLVGKEVVNLAWNEMTQVQATSYRNHIYTVQFHPEFNRDIMHYYIEANRENLEKYHLRNPGQVLSPDALLKRNKQLMKIHLVLDNFIKIAGGMSSAK